MNAEVRIVDDLRLKCLNMVPLFENWLLHFTFQGLTSYFSVFQESVMRVNYYLDYLTVKSYETS